MELTHQSYESFMCMPYGFFDSFDKWKTDMVKEQNQRNKKELDEQQKIQNKLKGQQHLAQTRSRLKQESNKRK